MKETLKDLIIDIKQTQDGLKTTSKWTMLLQDGGRLKEQYNMTSPNS